MHAQTHDMTHDLLLRVRRLQYAEDVSDRDYKLAMDLGDFGRAEELAGQNANLWIRYSRLSSIRGQQGRLDEAIRAMNLAEHEIKTNYERAAHSANTAHYLVALGEPDNAIQHGVDAVLLDSTVVMGAVNACSGASIIRSRSKLLDLLKLFAEKVPTVLSHPIWFERWQNDPHLAFARAHLIINS